MHVVKAFAIRHGGGTFFEAMKIPALTGIIRRRLLINYRVSPSVVQAIIPERFRPKLVDGHAIAGICLIRLEKIRPKGTPSAVGISSENSAHRIAVEWQDDNGQTREGVFVPRRDTDSWLNALAGGRLFPGVHHHSSFLVEDEGGRISMRIDVGGRQKPLVALEAQETTKFPETSVFESLEDSSSFFEAGCVGYSSRPDSCKLDGLLLKVTDWKVAPLVMNRIESSFYDDPSVFPEGSIHFDHGLLMRDIPHEWHSEHAMN